MSEEKELKTMTYLDESIRLHLSTDLKEVLERALAASGDQSEGMRQQIFSYARATG